MMNNIGKTIGVQTFTWAKGQKTLWCSLIGHRWEEEAFAGGIGPTDESVTRLSCKNSRCIYEYYEFRNYTYLTEPRRMGLAEQLGWAVRALDFMFGETDEP